MEIADMYYNKDEFVETASGNKVKLEIGNYQDFIIL